MCSTVRHSTVVLGMTAVENGKSGARYCAMSTRSACSTGLHLRDAALTDDALIRHGAVAALVVEDERVPAVHLERDERIFCDEVVLRAGARSVEVQADGLTVDLQAEVQRQDVGIRLVVQGEAADVAPAHDGDELLKISDLPIGSAHGNAPF